MKGIYISTWIKILGTALGLVISISLAQAESKKSIVIIKSSENSYFNTSIETLISLSSEEINFKIINARTDDLKNLLNNKNDLLITFGITATRAVLETRRKPVTISAYITQDQFYGLPVKTGRHFPILLDQPLERYMAFVHALIKPSTVGIINQKKTKLNRKQKQLFSKLKIKLVQKQLNNHLNLLSSIRMLNKESNALLMLPDQELFNRDTLKGVLLTTYRNRIPVISYSPAHVKSGALASIYSSPEDIGRHLADQVKRYQNNRLKPELAPQFARYFSIATNNRVARAFGLNLPDHSKIRQFLNEVSP